MSLETLSQTDQNLDNTSKQLRNLAAEFEYKPQNLQQEQLRDSPVHSALRIEWLITKDIKHGNHMADEYESNWWKNIDKSTLNNLIIKWMKNGWLQMRNEKKYTLEEMLALDKNINNNGIINLEDKTIKDINNDRWTPIKFKTYEELFDVVRLTTKIRQTFSGKKCKSEEPFHINTRWQIEFDNQPRLKFRNNDEISVKNKDMKKTCPTLRENKEYYIKYLNTWRENWGKVEWVY